MSKVSIETRKSFFDDNVERDYFWKIKEYEHFAKQVKTLEGSFHKKRSSKVFNEWKSTTLSIYGSCLVEKKVCC